MRDQAIRAGGEDPGKPLHFVTGEIVGEAFELVGPVDGPNGAELHAQHLFVEEDQCIEGPVLRRRGHVALRRQVVQNGADVVRLETEGRLYLHGSGEPEASEGDTADVTLFRTDEHGTRFRSTAGVNLAREDRKVLTTGDSVVLPDGRAVLPYLVRLGDPSVYESKTLAPPLTGKEASHTQQPRSTKKSTLRVGSSSASMLARTSSTSSRWNSELPHKLPHVSGKAKSQDSVDLGPHADALVLPFVAGVDLSPLGREVDSLRIGVPSAQSTAGRGTRAFREVWKRFLTG